MPTIATLPCTHIVHVLTKEELQVLPGLLNAYSDVRIKEIRGMIERKQDGVITCEEVESLLRQRGFVNVAGELEEKLLKGTQIFKLWF